MYFTPESATKILNSWNGWNISVLIMKKNAKERRLSGVLRHNDKKFFIIEEDGINAKVRTIPMDRILQIDAPCLHIYPQQPKVISEDDTYYTYQDMDNWIWYVAKP